MRKRKSMDAVEQAFDLALRIANSFRGKIGEKQIAELPAGVASDTNHCILARAFDADGLVSYTTKEGGAPVEESDGLLTPGGRLYGWVEFEDRQTADAFAASVVENDPDVEQLPVKEGSDYAWKIELPTAVTQIAFDFDHNQLIEDLYVGEVEALPDLPMAA